MKVSINGLLWCLSPPILQPQCVCGRETRREYSLKFELQTVVSWVLGTDELQSSVRAASDLTTELSLQFQYSLYICPWSSPPTGSSTLNSHTPYLQAGGLLAARII